MRPIAAFRRLRLVLLSGTALTLVALGSPTGLQAATDTYDGAGATHSNGNFNDATNYDNGAPAGADTAIFADNATITPKTTAITFANAANSLTTLSFTGTTAYNFTLSVGQTLSPTSFTSASTANQTFNISGVGAGLTIGSLANNAAGGETFAAGGTSNGVAITNGASIGAGTLTFTGHGATVGGAFTSTTGTLNLSGVTSGTNSLGSLAGNGTIVLGANTLSIGGSGSTTMYGGAISGTGGLTITGGTLTLGAANSYTGTTTITSGTLQAGIANTIAASSNVVVNGGNFDANNYDQSFANLSGTGGTVSFESQTLTVGSGNASSTYAGVIQDDNTGISTFNKVGTGTLTLTNVFMGSGTVNVNGGTLALSSDQLDYANYTNVNAGGTLEVTGMGTLGAGSVSGVGNIVIDNGATLNSQGVIDSTISGVISGPGALAISELSGGVLTLTGANTYSGGTNVSYAESRIGSNSAYGSGPVTLSYALVGLSPSATTVTLSNPVTLQNTETVDDASGQTLTLSGIVSGMGSLTKTGTGTLVLSGANTFAGGITVSGGTLSGTIASLPGPIVNNGIVQFNQAANGAYTNMISGTGMLSKVGVGNLTLGAANTYSGGTEVGTGILSLGTNNAAGTGSLTIDSNGTFNLGTFNQTVSGVSGAGTIVSTGGILSNNGAGTFTGTIVSTAPLTKSGSGMQVLDGTSTFSSTTVSSGTLAVGDSNSPNARLISPVTVTGGGTLMGHGSVVGNISNGGTVRPGGSVGTLGVVGNYTQAPSATLAIEVNPIAASKLQVTGSASLAGTLALSFDPGNYRPTMQYQIVSADQGVFGAFTNVTEAGQSVLVGETYTPNALYLTVGSRTVAFDMGATTPNELNALGVIEGLLPGTNFSTFRTGLFDLGLSTGVKSPQLAGTLGELRADLATVDLANLTNFQNFLIERMDRRQGLTNTMEVNNGLPGTFDVAQNGASDMPLFGPGGELTVDQPSFWFHGYGVLGEAGGESGFSDYQYRTGGIVGGADVKVTDTLLLGAAVAYEHTDLGLSGDSDENNIDTYRISLYGSQKLDPIGVPLTLDAAFGYAFNDYHNNDFLPLSTGGFSQTSRHDGNELTAESGLSQDVHIAQTLLPGALTVVPRVGLEYDNIQQNPYTTTGAPDPGLNFATNGSTLNALRSTVGARADLKLITDNGTIVTPELRAAYLHDFMDTNVPLTEAFTAAPTAGFRIAGVHPGREAALVGTGVTIGFSEKISATIGYDAAIRDRELDHTVQVGVKYKW